VRADVCKCVCMCSCVRVCVCVCDDLPLFYSTKSGKPIWQAADSNLASPPTFDKKGQIVVPGYAARLNFRNGCVLCARVRACVFAWIYACACVVCMWRVYCFEFLLCLLQNRTTGDLIWSAFGTSYLPVVLLDDILLTTTPGYLTCYSVSNGKIDWQFKFSNSTPYSYESNSPLIDMNGNVFFGSRMSQSVYAFAGESGKVAWMYNMSSPILTHMALGSDSTLIVLTQKGVYAINDGEKECKF
jgi:outer membrane protein assembly factor BamB